MGKMLYKEFDFSIVLTLKKEGKNKEILYEGESNVGVIYYFEREFLFGKKTVIYKVILNETLKKSLARAVNSDLVEVKEGEQFGYLEIKIGNSLSSTPYWDGRNHIKQKEIDVFPNLELLIKTMMANTIKK